MPQQLDNLVFDRSQSDVSRVQSLTQKMIAGTATEAEKAEWLGGKMKGAWNAFDLNRIEAWTAYLYDVLLGYGYTATITPRNPDRPGGGILPDGYTQLEYIQSSGTQYIDTGVKANTQTRVQAKMRYVVAPSESAWAALFGSRNGSGNQEYWVYYRPDDSAFSLKYGNDTSNYTVPGSPEELNNFSVNGNTLSVNGQSVTANLDALESKNSFYIFAVNNSGSLQYASKSALYQFTVYSKSERVRDFVPCTNPSGTVGLYDLINGEFYANTGTGDFIAGPEIVPEEPEPNDDLWIESDIPYRSEIDRIRANVDALQTGFASLPDWQEIVYNNTMTFGQANALEWDLQRLYDWLQAMVNGFMTKQANTLFMVAGGVFNN